MHNRANIPTTKAEAIAALVESDVERWGESQRNAAQAMHDKNSFGLALNSLAARAELAGRPCDGLYAAAKRVMTAADWRVIRSGG